MEAEARCGVSHSLQVGQGVYPLSISAGKRRPSPSEKESSFNTYVANNLIRVRRDKKGCRHDFASSYIEFEEGKHYYISYFCSIFFLFNDTIEFLRTRRDC